jgi:cation diffusion facilitator family transporter
MTIHGRAFVPPPDKRQAIRRAVRIEWLSIGLMITVVTVIGLTTGSSEAMKAVWIEDLLSLIPPIAFLVGVRYRDHAPTDKFPYGYRRAALIGFMVSAVTLLAFGLYILGEAIVTLVTAEHPTIGTIGLFDRRIWLGWLMIGALVYSAIPPMILGRIKLRLARELRDKTLQTDADLNKGDWLTAIAGIFGIVGVGLGYWWIDATAAAVISIEILKDGIENLRNSIGQLMNQRPTDVATKKKDPVLDRVEKTMKRLDWVREVRVRLREDGDTLSGEAFLVPRDENDLFNRIEEATRAVHTADWRLHDINIVLLRSLDGADDQHRELARRSPNGNNSSNQARVQDERSIP